MPNIDIKELVVRVPSFDINVNEPFNIDLRDLMIEIPTNIDYKVELPPLLKVEIPVIEKDIDELVHIISQDIFTYSGSSFDDVITSVPILEDMLVKYDEDTKEKLVEKIKNMTMVKLSFKPGKIIVEITSPIKIGIPREIHERYSIKVKISRRITPEVRELIENRLTREFKITRMIKKMEIIREEKIIYELEKMLRKFSKKIRRY